MATTIDIQGVTAKADHRFDIEINRKYQDKDKADRATVEQVLDPRTRLILFKLLNQGYFNELQGCISTGKEANVYLARAETGAPLAVKIYKTSILLFKDRHRYVIGEFRFRNSYLKSNPRKMIKVWAEKELRNLKRLVDANIPCPVPIHLKSHVLVMNFIGDPITGRAAPKLKDALILDSALYSDLYVQALSIMRKLFHECRLVHADLSEYNLLYYDRKLYVIDVSQSVEHEHPYALDFLRMDCQNIREYFLKHGVSSVLSLRVMFDWITSIQYPTFDAAMSALNELLVSPEVSSLQCCHTLQVDDQVFLKSYIPQSLDQVLDVERDIAKLSLGKTDDLLYGHITGLPSLAPKLTSPCPLDSVPASEPFSEHADSATIDSESVSSSDTESLSESLELESVTDVMSASTDGSKATKKAMRKENKKLVKAENKLRRETKMKKSEKKQLLKKSKK